MTLTPRTRREGPLDPGDPGDVLTQLQNSGITVHHAALMPAQPDAPAVVVVVVFLESTLYEQEEAVACVHRMPGVVRVELCASTASIMYVLSRPRPAEAEAPPDPDP